MARNDDKSGWHTKTFTCFFGQVMATLNACAVCGKCFSVTKGVKFSSVPLYKETAIKEIVGDGAPVKIASLLEEIGISVTHLSEPYLSAHSLCRKCARKISISHRAYLEIASAVKTSQNGGRQSSCCEPDSVEKRAGHILPPSGLTPNKKRPKGTEEVTSFPAYENVSSRKRLFIANSSVADEICNLMSLPAEERNEPTVKVRFLCLIFLNFQPVAICEINIDPESRSAIMTNCVASLFCSLYISTLAKIFFVT